MSSPATPAISVRRLTKSFGAVTVLHDIDVEIGGGEFIGLMGPNGAGKSTLIKILDGIYDASGGEIRLDGKPVSCLADSADVGFIHQDLGLIDDLSIVDNLRLGERPLRLIGPILDRRAERLEAERALKLVELDAPVDTEVGMLSPGEKTLVAVARVFARGARILFVDEATSTLPPGDARRVIASLAKAALCEPTRGVDVATRAEIYRLIRQLRNGGSGILIVSSDTEDLLAVCDRIAVVIGGVLSAVQPAEDMELADLEALV